MRRPVRIAAALTTVLLTGSCGLSLRDAGVGTFVEAPSKHVTAVFADAGRLPVGGIVRIGQQEVGRVTAIRTRNFQALVDMDITDTARIPSASTAELQLASPLGEAYVMLQPPPNTAGPVLGDGAVIPLERTSRGPDLEDTLAAVGTMLTGSGLDQARTVVGELNTSLQGREGTVRDLLTQLQTVLGSLQRHRDDINRIIGDLHATSDELNRNKPLIDAAFTQIKPGVDALLAEQDRFNQLLRNTAALSGTANDLTRRTSAQVTDEVHNIRPVLEQLRGFDAGMGQTLDGLNRFGQLFRQATPGDYVQFNGTLDVPGSFQNLLPPAPAPAPGGGAR